MRWFERWRTRRAAKRVMLQFCRDSALPPALLGMRPRRWRRARGLARDLLRRAPAVLLLLVLAAACRTASPYAEASHFNVGGEDASGVTLGAQWFPDPETYEEVGRPSAADRFLGSRIDELAARHDDLARGLEATERLVAAAREDLAGLEARLDAGLAADPGQPAPAPDGSPAGAPDPACGATGRHDGARIEWPGRPPVLPAAARDAAVAPARPEATHGGPVEDPLERWARLVGLLLLGAGTLWGGQKGVQVARNRRNGQGAS